MRNALITLAGIALVVAVILVLAGRDGDDGTSPGEDAAASATADLRVDASQWDTDFTRHSVPLSEFVGGGPPRDGIPPLDEPAFVSQARADEWLAPREPVMVVELAGRARAYPLQILIWHEIVNDSLGGRPIAVTYCPLCNSALVFDRRVDDRLLTFGTTGNLRRSDLVMWDRQTESWWQQLTGEAVVGELTGSDLEAIPSQTLSWSDFRRLHPRGDVLSRETGFDRDYGRNPYVGYDEPDQRPFLLREEPDPRLPAKARVAAVFAGDEVAVVPFTRLRERPVASLEVGDTPVVVFFDPDVASALDASAIAESDAAGTAAAFDRRVDGRPLDFRPRSGSWVDEQTGSDWDLAGRATSGPLRGSRLQAVRSDQQFWFALAAFVPDARIVG